jgi:hypothetical protein
MSKFDIEVQLVGLDGNAYAIMGRVMRALRDAGATKAQVDEYQEQATSGDYDNLLRVTSEWVEVY